MKQIIFIIGILVLALGGLAYMVQSRINIPATYADIEDSNQLLATPPQPSINALRIPILIYHTVHPDRTVETASQKHFNVSPAMFETQLQYLQSRGYSVISMDQLYADLEAATTSSITKPIVITFDDGSRGQYEYAFPLLKKYHDTATFYIYTHPINIHDKYFLSWNEVKEMAATGMTIGSHSVSHPYLTKLNPQELHHEIWDSKKMIEDMIGLPVVHFATPFGAMNPAIEQLLMEAGYETNRGTYRGTYHVKRDEMQLTGYFVPNDMKNFAWIIEHAK